jgi:ABC-type ATPase involved in cell division
MIALKNVTKSYDGKSVLSNLSLTIDPGACLCVVGESGSGKTTLMRLMMRAEDPTEGLVEVDGVNIRTLPAPILQLYRRRVGVIFQEPILLEHATIEENLGLPLELLGAPAALITRNTTDLLKRLHLAEKSALFPRDLSFSERSLVAIARALITAPMVIIADEPLHNLDAIQTKIVLELLTNMHKKGTTLVLFSRDNAVAHALKAKTVQIQNGTIAKQPTPEKVTQKASMDAHRILEEQESLSSIAGELEDEDAPLSVSHKKTGGNGKRIRITSIGSNS